MTAVMLDLAGADSGEDGNPGERPIDGVALHVREPVRDLEREVMKNRSRQKDHCRLEGKESGQESVVDGEKSGKGPGPPGDVLQVRLTRGAEIHAVEDAMVLDVVPSDVTEKGKPLVHRKPVRPVLE
jgi:hypothetical protein